MTRYTLRPDGRDVPISGSPVIIMRADTISTSRLGPSTFVWSDNKGGVPVLSLRGMLAANGRTLTMTAPDNQVLVYEKE